MSILVALFINFVYVRLNPFLNIGSPYLHDSFVLKFGLNVQANDYFNLPKS